MIKCNHAQDRKWQSLYCTAGKTKISETSAPNVLCVRAPHASPLLLFRRWLFRGNWHADSHLCGSDEYGSEYHYESVPGGYCVFSSQLRGAHAVASHPDTYGSKAKDTRRPVQELSHYKHDSIAAMDRPFVPFFPRDEPPPERRRLDTNPTSGWFKCRYENADPGAVRVSRMAHKQLSRQSLARTQTDSVPCDTAPRYWSIAVRWRSPANAHGSVGSFSINR